MTTFTRFDGDKPFTAPTTFTGGASVPLTRHDALTIIDRARLTGGTTAPSTLGGNPAFSIAQVVTPGLQDVSSLGRSFERTFITPQSEVILDNAAAQPLASPLPQAMLPTAAKTSVINDQSSSQNIVTTAGTLTSVSIPQNVNVLGTGINVKSLLIGAAVAYFLVK